MKVFIPNTFQPERVYIIDVLLGEFLGLRFETEFYEQRDYEIVLSNNMRMVIQDHFFSKVYGDDGYLRMDSIPDSVIYTTNPFTPEMDIPIIYGKSELKVDAEKLECGIDIFASSFFMLTRWEEYVKPDRDVYNRFPVASSLAYTHDFLDRPVVNEYVEMLWNMMKFLGEEQERKERSFTFVLTHDVDHIRLWNSFKDVGRTMLGDLWIRKSLPLFLSRGKQYFHIKTGKKKDPYDTFNDIMDYSEYLGIQSRFYFMSGGRTSFDNRYKIDEPTVKGIMDKIIERGHVIGFHPSFDSYNSPTLWNKEKHHVEEVLGCPVKEGRQHYLRFSVPTTWDIWERNQMEVDMTLGYPEKEGFRCGTCYEYSVFNVVSRKKLQIKESPLIVMETNFEYSNEIDPQIMYTKISRLKEKVEKYKGNFVLLWHNSNFNHGEWSKVRDIYFRILK